MTISWLTRWLPSHRTPAVRRQRRCRPVIERLEDRLTPSSTPVPAHIDYHVTSDWGSGFSANLTITNDQAVPVTDWSLQFNFAPTIGSIWDAAVVSHTGSQYVLTHADWNGTIAAHGSVTLGFNGSAGSAASAPTNAVLSAALPAPTGGGTGQTNSPAPANIQFSVTTDWGSGFGANIAITNSQSTALNNWNLAFDFAHNISSIWNAQVTSHIGNHYVIAPAAWNNSIAPGATVSFGFNGDPGNVTDTPINYVLGGTSGSTSSGGGTSTGGTGGTVQTAPAAPAKPTLSVQSDPSGDGSYNATFNLWYGTNATSWKLLQNGQTIYSAPLTANTPGPQTGSFHITGKTYGAYTYQVVLSNAAGSTSSDPRVYTVGGASKIAVAPADGATQALQVTINQGVTDYTLNLLGGTNPTFTVAVNNSSVIAAQLVGPATLRLTGLSAGLASVKIVDTTSGEVRFLGVRVRTATGQLPGMPSYLAVGSVSEDTPSDLQFLEIFGTGATNTRIDIRYIYLNGGPFTGWRTWTPQDGGRLISYLQWSEKLGIIPYFVWYNIPDGGESYFTDLQHIQSQSYMQAYFRDLAFAMGQIHALAPDQTVGMVLEPDFLGYLMQNSGLQANQIQAFTSAAYNAGVLSAATDPVFPDTVQGLVKAIDYIIAKYAPNVSFGWEVNLWASPGITTSIPATGLMHLTDALGITAGRAAIAREANAIAQYYINAGILTSGARFVAIDKYGLDAGAQNGAAANPAGSTWFWNDDLWNNYLLFCQVLHQATGLGIIPWQIPVGHINSSQAPDPYTGGLFPDLADHYQQYEDSAATFFLGDSFTATGSRFAYFATDNGGDPKVSISGSTITWGSHMQEAAQAGIIAILFGAGVGDSTQGVGSPPSDAYWWISKVQGYYQHPVALG